MRLPSGRAGAADWIARLYGRAAYEAWKTREAEIDKLVRQHIYSRSYFMEVCEND